MPYQLILTPRFRKGYRKKTADQKELVQQAIEQLSENPRHPGLNAHKVRGTKGVWECYTNDAFRITFEYGKENSILLRNTCSHDILKKP